MVLEFHTMCSVDVPAWQDVMLQNFRFEKELIGKFGQEPGIRRWGQVGQAKLTIK